MDAVLLGKTGSLFTEVAMFKSIFVPVDLEEPSSWSRALPVAISIAETNNAPLTLATVISDRRAVRSAEWSQIGYRKMLSDAETRLRRIVGSCGYDKVSVSVSGGPIGSSILDLARVADADLIVLASHRPGLKDYLIGANALHVVRHSTCSVFVVRE